MSLHGIATDALRAVTPTGYAKANNEVWIGGVRQDVYIAKIDDEPALEVAQAVGTLAVDQANTDPSAA